MTSNYDFEFRKKRRGKMGVVRILKKVITFRGDD